LPNDQGCALRDGAILEGSSVPAHVPQSTQALIGASPVAVGVLVAAVVVVTAVVAAGTGGRCADCSGAPTLRRARDIHLLANPRLDDWMTRTVTRAASYGICLARRARLRARRTPRPRLEFSLKSSAHKAADTPASTVPATLMPSCRGGESRLLVPIEPYRLQPHAPGKCWR